MYEYVNKSPEVGDIVLWTDLYNTSELLPNTPYIVKKVGESLNTVEVLLSNSDNKHTLSMPFGAVDRKVIKTLPGNNAKVGDTCIRIKYGSEGTRNGDLILVLKVDHAGQLHWNAPYPASNCKTHFLVLSKKESPKIIFTI